MKKNEKKFQKFTKLKKSGFLVKITSYSVLYPFFGGFGEKGQNGQKWLKFKKCKKCKKCKKWQKWPFLVKIEKSEKITFDKFITKNIPYYLIPIFIELRSIFLRNWISGQK